MRLGFGSTVKIRATPATEKLGLAGLKGTVFGETVPSISGITDVIVGNDKSDYAVNVIFEDLEIQHWFSEDLIEPLEPRCSIIGQQTRT